MKTRFLTLIVGLLAFGPLLAAQEAGGGLSVRFFSWLGDLSEVTANVGKESRPLVLEEFALGDELVFKQTAPVLKVSRIEPPAKPGESPRIVVLAEVPLPAGLTKAIIILAPAPASDGGEFPLMGKVLDLSEAAQPNESIRVINFSSHDIACRIGTEVSMLTMGKDAVVRYTTTGAPTVSLRLALQTQDGWQLIKSGLQPAPRNSRVIGFVRDGRLDTGNLDPNAKPAVADAYFFVLRTPPVKS